MADLTKGARIVKEAKMLDGWANEAIRRQGGAFD